MGKSKKLTVSLLPTMFLMVALSVVAYIVHAEQPYTTESELVCGSTKVQVITRCTDDSHPIVPDCVEQKFLFRDLTTGRTFSVPASGQLVTVKGANDRPIGRSLDALATSWRCIKGKSQPYLIIWYNSGGNCEECEWQEILDLTGKRLASTLPKTTQNQKAFNGLWSKLGLPNIGPGDFLTIRVHNR